MRKTSAAFAMGIAVVIASRSAVAAEPAHYDLDRTSWQALSVESLAAVTAYSGAWLVSRVPRETCSQCNSNSFDESVRSALRANHPRTVGFLSHGVSVGAVPVLALTGLIVPAYRDQQLHRGLEDTWIVANAFLITTAFGDLTKHWVARERPAFHHGLQSQTEMRNYPNERNKSFFSLDTAWAFAIASSATTLSHLHGYSSTKYVAIGSGFLAATAGTLRIVGDAHWATDVLTGAAIGTAIGIAVPVVLHPRQSNPQGAATSSALERSTGVSLAFTF